MSDLYLHRELSLQDNQSTTTCHLLSMPIDMTSFCPMLLHMLQHGTAAGQASCPCFWSAWHVHMSC